MQTGAGAANGWAVELEHLDPQGFLDEKGDVAEQVVRAERGSQLSPADPTTTALQPSSCGTAVALSLTRVPRWPPAVVYAGSRSALRTAGSSSPASMRLADIFPLSICPQRAYGGRVSPAPYARASGRLHTSTHRSGATANSRASSRSKATALRRRTSDTPPSRLRARSRVSSARRKVAAEAYLTCPSRRGRSRRAARPCGPYSDLSLDLLICDDDYWISPTDQGRSSTRAWRLNRLEFNIEP
jgi:hypothetical protein